LVAGLALLVGLGRIHGEQESAAVSPASALGPVHAVKITVLSTMLTDAVGGESAKKSGVGDPNGSVLEPKKHAVKVERMEREVPSDRESHESAPRVEIANEKRPESGRWQESGDQNSCDLTNHPEGDKRHATKSRRHADLSEISMG
jgi:hypothetical protein